jgi:uncharacterized protein YndB with AHSA1/START domain
MTEAGITLVRVFDAPRERVWKEWTEPERFADWFGGVECDVPLSSVVMDVREGGSWRLTMFTPRGELRWHGEYLEVVPPSRVVLTFCDQPEAADYELVTVELEDLGDGRTEMRFEQRGRLTPEQYKATGAGWAGFFDRIAERLKPAEPTR